VKVMLRNRRQHRRSRIPLHSDVALIHLGFINREAHLGASLVVLADSESTECVMP